MERVTTIVTCMVDAERPFLADTLRSVQRQTVASEIILCVADDNEWVDDLLGDIWPGIAVMRLKLALPPVIRNQAIATVKTELVAFLDGDDLWEPTKLRKQIDALDRLGLDVIGTQHILVRGDGVPYFFGFARRIPMTSSWLGKTSIFRERPFESVPREDVLLWERLESESEVRLGILDAFLIRYRVREVSLSTQEYTKKRKLAYAHRSRMPGMRPLLLAASYVMNIWLRLRRKYLGLRDLHVQSLSLTL